MSLTLSNLRSNITVALAGESVNTNLNQDTIINQAGRYFFDSHPWNFRIRPSLSIPLEGGVSYADAPVDFGEMISMALTNGSYGVTWTTPDQIAQYRASTYSPSSGGWHYWITITYPGQPSKTEAAPPPRFELYPTPPSGTDDTLTIFYRAKWTTLVDATDVADVPDFAEPALLEFVRRFAAGWQEGVARLDGGIDPLVVTLMESEMMKALKRRDGRTQRTYGPVRNGAIESLRGTDTYGLSRYMTEASAPS